MSERYCPNCGEVYDPGIDTCAECGIPLEDLPDEEAPVSVEPPEYEYVECNLLGHVTTLGEAYVIRAALAAEGIPVRIDNEWALNAGMGGVAMPAGGIALFVPVDAYSESASLLAEKRRSSLDYEELPAEETSLEKRLWRFYSWFNLALYIGVVLPVAAVLGVRTWKQLKNEQTNPLQRMLLTVGTLFAVAITAMFVIALIYWLVSPSWGRIESMLYHLYSD